MNTLNEKSGLRYPYVLIIIVAVIFLLFHYPKIYGVDAFQVLWMGQAIRDGALFSDPTWLIHPASYFGYYPFSFRAVGVPLIVAFLMSLIDILSFGALGLPEAVLLFNIILILITYKCARSLANSLFTDEWAKIIFVAAMVFCPRFFHSNLMTVSTRIFITICMIALLNINLKVLNNSIKKHKAILYMAGILLIGILAHRLSTGLLYALVCLIITLLIRKNKSLHHLSIFLILPLAILGYFYGLEVFQTYIGDYTPIEAAFYLTFPIPGGLLFILYPIGVIVSIYRLTYSFESFNEPKITVSQTKKNKSSYNGSVDKVYYLLLFIIPFSYTILTVFYAYVVFMPIIIFFSVQGLIYSKELLIRFWNNQKKYLSYIYEKLEDLKKHLYKTLISLPGLDFLQKNITSSSKLKNSTLLKIFRRIKWRKIALTGILCSILTYSIINIELHSIIANDSSYPWENRHISDEEKEIITFFQQEEVQGLIFVSNSFIAERLAGIGFLPAFSESTVIGIPLYYGLISPAKVHENTFFSWSYYIQFNFFVYNNTDPITEIRHSISELDLTQESEFNTFLSYNIQYIVTINETYQSGGVNNWELVQSIQESKLVYYSQPFFKTTHFVVWRIY